MAKMKVYELAQEIGVKSAAYVLAVLSYPLEGGIFLCPKAGLR